MNGWALLSVLALAGCATTYHPLPVSMVPDPEPVAQPAVSAHAPTWSPRHAPGELIEPSSGNFIEFPWYDRAVYVIYTSPERPTTLVFGPKEEWRYTSQVGERWQMEEITRDLPFHIVLTPKEPTLRSRLVVRTSTRTYFLDLRATPKRSLVEVRWEQPTPPRTTTVTTARYGIGYGLSVGDYSFRPNYIWDNGVQTFILFPESLPSGDAPVVGIRSRDLRELVNHRMHGRVMRIDRMIDQTEAIELKVGVEQPRIIEIRRTDGYRQVDCPAAQVCSFIEAWKSKERDVAERP
jgi:type IV secretory pathway VirB9-like protein